MDRPSVYLESSVISYLAARPSRNPVIQAQHTVTQVWWRDRRHEFDLFVSQGVIDEVAAGDPEAAARRLAVIVEVAVLRTPAEAFPLALHLLNYARLPPKALADAVHVAVAALNGMEYLLTWNCKHIAHATSRALLEDGCRAAHLKPPIICTPFQLVDEVPDV